MRGLGVLVLIIALLLLGATSLFLFLGAVALGFQEGTGLALLGLLTLGFCVAIIQSLRNMSGDNSKRK